MGYTNGKIAAVTGAGSGIGRALALQLNREGCRVYLSDISEEGLGDTLALLPRPELADTRVLDVADRQAVHDWAEHISATHGHVDIVINNAGVTVVSTVEKDTYDNIEWLMGINFWGVVYGTRAFLPLLRRSEQGHLVNLSSVFGLISVPTQSAYHAAKFAVRGYTDALRQELSGTNVHVCCVHPGGIKTNIARAARSTDQTMSAEQRGDEFERIVKTSPEEAARQIVEAMKKRKPRLLIGKDALIISFISRLFPVSYPRILNLFVNSGDVLKNS